MKKMWKRLLICLLAVVVAFSCWWDCNLQIQAGGYSVSGLWNLGMVNSDYLENGVDHSALIYWYMNGTRKISYCLQYGYQLSSGQEFGSTEESLSTMTEEQVRQLRYCLYYGYQADSYGICPHGDGLTCQEEWIPYAATQAMVWLIVAGKYNEPGAVETWGQIVANSTGYADRVLAEYRTLYAEMDAALQMKPPSFSETDNAAASTYTMEWDPARSSYSLTLTDESGVLSQYNWTLPEGVSASRSGNQITFTTTQEINVAELVQFDAKSGAAANREVSALLFWHPSDASKQNQVQYESVTYDPLRSYLYLKTGEKSGTVSLRKLDSSSKTPVGGAVYGIYSDEACTVLVTKVTTDASGYVVSEEIPAATYYVREITAPTGYQLSGTVYPVTVSAGTTVSLDTEDSPVFGCVQIEKTDAVSGEVLTETGFMLEQWSVAQNAYVQVGSIGYNSATGCYETGVLSYTQDNQGRYRVCESQAQAGYIAENWMQSFTLTDYASGYTQTYQLTNTPTRYRFTKKNDSGQALADCDFQLLDASGNVVTAWTSDSDGIYELTGTLVEGATYTLREIDCPLGYTKAADYTFTVSSEKQWVEITTVNTAIHASVRINKRDTSGNPLSGAVFALMTTQAISGADTLTYDGKTYYTLKTAESSEGLIEFQGINASDGYYYLLVETESAAGTMKLKDPIELGKLPVAAVNGVSANYNGKQQTKDGMTYLYDLTYTVVNTANMVLPLTGETGSELALVPVMCIVLALFLVAAMERKKGGMK